MHVDDDDSGPDDNLMSGSAALFEVDLCQDDYQQVMLHSHPTHTNTSLLRFHKLDLAHQWLSLWLGVPINWLLIWLSSTKDDTTLPSPLLPPFTLGSLSEKQCTAFDIIQNHSFSDLQHQQLLMVVLGTVGTGKSFLINAIQHLFTLHSKANCLRVTALTGIAAANICGSTIHSLLSLLPVKENLTGACLNFLQTTLADM